MQAAVSKLVQAAIPVYADCVALGTTAISREEFVHEWQGQVALLTTQMAWTAESEAAISRFAAGKSNALELQAERQVEQL